VGSFVEPWKAAYSSLWSYSKGVQLNALVIYYRRSGRGLLAGIPGALLAIPVAEIIWIVLTYLLAYRRTRQDTNEPGRLIPLRAHCLNTYPASCLTTSNHPEGREPATYSSLPGSSVGRTRYWT
jgi:hypothetical protein